MVTIDNLLFAVYMYVYVYSIHVPPVCGFYVLFFINISLLLAPDAPMCDVVGGVTLVWTLPPETIGDITKYDIHITGVTEMTWNNEVTNPSRLHFVPLQEHFVGSENASIQVMVSVL